MFRGRQGFGSPDEADRPGSAPFDSSAAATVPVRPVRFTGTTGRSDAADRQREVVTTEPERVVQGCDVALGELAVLTMNHVEGDRGVEVVEVDRCRRQPVVDRQDGED